MGNESETATTEKILFELGCIPSENKGLNSKLIERNGSYTHHILIPLFRRRKNLVVNAAHYITYNKPQQKHSTLHFGIVYTHSEGSIFEIFEKVVIGKHDRQILNWEEFPDFYRTKLERDFDEGLAYTTQLLIENGNSRNIPVNGKEYDLDHELTLGLTKSLYDRISPLNEIKEWFIPYNKLFPDSENYQF